MGRLIVANEAVVVIGAILQMLIGKKNRPLGSKGIAKYLLGWSLPLNVGLMGIQFFLGHTARAEKTAEGLGWPSGNPFQTEVAIANLSFGVLGLLCVRFRGPFWSATALGHAIFMLGAAALHAREMAKEKNFSPGNAGPVFYYDVVVPLAHLSLLRAHGRPEPRGKGSNR